MATAQAQAQAQANTSMPELPSAAQANAQGNGRPFANAGATTTTTTGATTTTTSTTTAGTTTTTTTEATTTTTSTTTAGCDGGCCWKLNERYCLDGTGGGDCLTFNTCPPSTAAGSTIGEWDNYGYISPVDLKSFTSDTEIEIFLPDCGLFSPATLSADGNSFTSLGNTWTIV